MSTVLQAALDYAAQGRRVHPCRPDNKRPLTRWGTQATTDPDFIRYWWGLPRPPADVPLLAVCTGDGLVVVDVDPRNGGERYEDLFSTLTATTRGGGWHHWFKTDDRIPNVIGLVDGVDIRGDGGYVIAPPSPGWDWLNARQLDHLPTNIAEAIEHRRTAAKRGPGFIQAEAGSVGEGRRHDYMVRFAGWAIRALEPAGAAELGTLCIEEYLRACYPHDAPLDNIRRIARSIWRADQRA